MEKMKSVALLAFALILTMGSGACQAQESKKQETAVKTDKIEVYYFHFTRRCVTCQAVEEESKQALEMLYPQLIKNGKVTFTSANLDDDKSKQLAEKCKAAGQSLLVISGNKRIDLTNQGFMYARNNPDKLKEEIKKAVDPLLSSK